MRLGRVMGIARVEVLRLLRDRASLALIISLPAIQVLLFGGAVELNPTHVTIAIAGDAGAPATRLLVEQTGRFDIIADGLPPGQAEALLRAGHVLVALETPRPPTEANPDAPEGRTRLLVDGTNPQEVEPALESLQTGALRSRLEMVNFSGRPPPSVDWLYNAQRQTSWTIMPALVGVIVMISTLLLGALVLVRERELGHWESLLASPATPLDLITGKLLPYLVIAPVQAMVVLLVAHFGFGVPWAGDVAALVACVPVFAAAHLLLGFALSAAAQTQVQAIQLSVFFYLPCMLLSGFMFPFAAMPAWAQLIGNGLPLTHFVRAARDVLLKGAGAGIVAAHMVPVAAFALVSGCLAMWVCGKRVE